MKNNTELGEALLLSFIEDDSPPQDLSADAHDALIAAIAPIQSLLSKFERELRKKGSDLPQGRNEFQYAGATYMRKAHSRTVAYKKAFELASSMVTDEELRTTIKQTVEEEFTKQTFKNVRIK